MSEMPHTPNREQAQRWNAAVGQVWVELQELLDRLFAPFAARIVDDGFPGEGGRVLDLGCGAGATTLAMARRVGPSGRCLGIDLSQTLADAAATRARAAGFASTRFVCADAQTYAFEPAGFDAAISRFGVMFFDDPAAAFANIRRAVRPGGKLAFAAWRGPEDNPFMTAPPRAAAPLLPGLLSPQDQDAPGQFAFARAERVRSILADAGWDAIEIEPLDVDGALSVHDLAVFATRMGPVGQMLQGLEEPERGAVVQAVMQSFDPFTRDGVANFVLAGWRVTARA